jgi:dimethylargininase
MPIAMTRPVSPRMGDCELTFLPRVEIDVELARVQHDGYQAALAALGCQLVPLPVEPDLPDSIFVEDIAIVLREAAIITRPGAESRRPETESVARALKAYRELIFIQAPGTLEGGDVLRVGQTLYVGLSDRSNGEGIDQLSAATAAFGYTVVPVPVSGCLHLKSAVTQVAPNTLLMNRQLVEASYFSGLEVIDVHDAEPLGANALLIGDQVIYPASFPYTRKRLLDRGIRVKCVEVSEVEKAEGAVTCCSLIFDQIR